MNEISFAWDERKSRANQRKHGVAFEEAQTSFLDENAKIYADPDHSEDEDRFILLGMSFRLHLGGVSLLPRDGIGDPNHFRAKSG
jgi:uncharacterized protein